MGEFRFSIYGELIELVTNFRQLHNYPITKLSNYPIIHGPITSA